VPKSFITTAKLQSESTDDAQLTHGKASSDIAIDKETLDGKEVTDNQNVETQGKSQDQNDIDSEPQDGENLAVDEIAEVEPEIKDHIEIEPQEGESLAANETAEAEGQNDIETEPQEGNKLVVNKTVKLNAGSDENELKESQIQEITSETEGISEGQVNIDATPPSKKKLDEETKQNVESEGKSNTKTDSVKKERLVVMNARELNPVTKDDDQNQESKETKSKDTDSFELTTEVTSEIEIDLSEENEISTQGEEVKIQNITKSESKQQDGDNLVGIESINGTADTAEAASSKERLKDKKKGNMEGQLEGKAKIKVEGKVKSKEKITSNGETEDASKGKEDENSRSNEKDKVEDKVESKAKENLDSEAKVKVGSKGTAIGESKTKIKGEGKAKAKGKGKSKSEGKAKDKTVGKEKAGVDIEGDILDLEQVVDDTPAAKVKGQITEEGVATLQGSEQDQDGLDLKTEGSGQNGGNEDESLFIEETPRTRGNQHGLDSIGKNQQENSLTPEERPRTRVGTEETNEDSKVAPVVEEMPRTSVKVQGNAESDTNLQDGKEEQNLKDAKMLEEMPRTDVKAKGEKDTKGKKDGESEQEAILDETEEAMQMTQEEEQGKINISNTSDVLDTGAWLANWLMAIGLYAGRQERPWSRDSKEPLDDLPNIYIPNELTGNQIVRALKLTGKEQMVIEENEYLNFLNFNLIQNDDFDETNETSEDYDREPRQSTIAQFLDKEDGRFVFSEYFINQTMAFVQSPISRHSDSDPLSSQLGDDVIDAILEVLASARVKTSHSSWDDMIKDIDEQYQQMMRILEKRSMVKKTDGFYTVTKSGTELVHKALNATILKAQELWRFRDWQNDYEQYKAYKDFNERIGQMIQSSAAILHLPSEISWANIKATIQIMYKKAIPQVHLYQFLTRTLDYLEVDTNVKGVSKLSPFVTQLLVDAMWGMFGYSHPLRILT